MKIAGSVALVTGANRGLGQAYTRELVRRAAAKVYGAARQPGQVTEPGVIPIALDITDPHRVGDVAAECPDVSLLVNNAGVMKASTFIDAPSLDAARAEMETNYFGTLSMCRAFAPVLAANGGGAIVNMLSVTSFYTNPFNSSYGASKAAGWSLTNGVRLELHHQGTLVVAVHAGFIDTDMAALASGPKDSPEDVVRQALDAVEPGQPEVLADERTRTVKASLSRDHEPSCGRLYVVVGHTPVIAGVLAHNDPRSPYRGAGGRPAPGAPVTRCPRSAEAGDADQVALGVGEVAHD